MEKRYIPSLDRHVSLLGFGAMRLPLLPENQTAVDQKLTEAMIDRAMSAGVNYFDTAFTYHNGISELLVGRILRKYPRESFHLANKMPLWSLKSRDDAERIFASQLKKCRVEHFDFYLLHGLNRALYQQAVQLDIYAWLREKKEMGLVRHMGFSFHDSPELFQKIVDAHTWDFAQIQLNYVDWEAGGARELYAILEKKGLPGIVMEPVRGGSLVDLPSEAQRILREMSPKASMASWAVRYAASLPQIMVVLSGMSNLTQMEDNIQTMSPLSPITAAENNALEKVASLYLASGDIPCTGCKYCVDCPQGVNIPSVFAAYNHRKHGNFKLLYPTIAENAQAHNCIKCGECLRYCPQKIDIPSRLQEVAAYAERQ